MKKAFLLALLCTFAHAIALSNHTHTSTCTHSVHAKENSSENDANKYSGLDLHPPLSIPMFLAGNFCELRSNHFHTGLDIKTGGVIGKKVHSIEKGYVSRIKVGLWGYGNVVYVTHPNGYTSVYAHLNRFNDKLAAFVKAAQYKAETYEIELFPSATDLVLSRGEVLGISGNSGSSTAPHLHFEIRETASENPINPLLFGFDIKDQVKPTIRQFRIYPLNENTAINKKNKATTFAVTGSNGVYKAKSSTPIQVHGEVGFALDVIDRLNGVSNKCGIYTIALSVDGEQVFGQRMEKMDFAVNRYINAHMDYGLFKTNKGHFQRSYLLPNNRLKIYENLKREGKVLFTDDKEHQIQYDVVDTYGNKSSLTFKVQSLPQATPVKSAKNYHKRLRYDQEEVISTEGFEMKLPANILYDNLDFKFAAAKSPYPGSKAKLYQLHNYLTPLQSYFNLKFKVDSIDPALHSKLMVVSINKRGHAVNEGGKFENGWITAKSRSFGKYTVMLDKTPPAVKGKNIYPGKNMSANTEISLTISDNLAGIESYRGTIDGKWFLFQYKPRRNKLVYVIDERLKPGKHHLKVEVADERGNTTTYEADFTR